jgi:hypothetical protein
MHQYQYYQQDHHLVLTVHYYYHHLSHYHKLIVVVIFKYHLHSFVYNQLLLRGTQLWVGKDEKMAH